MSRRIYASSYLGVNTRKDQNRLVNPTFLDSTTGYIVEYDVGAKSLKNMPQLRLNFTNGSV